ncbi:MAG: hypothetical protein WC756_03530 [Taibaiella sp.]|jgi:hypothetical protein
MKTQNAVTLIVIILILFGCQTGEPQSQSLAPQTNTIEKKVDPVLNLTLDQICNINKEIGQMESTTRDLAETLYRDDVVPRERYLTEIRKSEGKKIMRKHNLNDTLYLYVIAFSFKDCK